MAFTGRFESAVRHGIAISASAPIYDLDDDRIMIDIETERIIRSQMQSKSARRIPHFLVEGRTLGPLSVLLILGLYSLFSPLLSPTIHQYVYRILH